MLPAVDSGDDVCLVDIILISLFDHINHNLWGIKVNRTFQAIGLEVHVLPVCFLLHLCFNMNFIAYWTGPYLSMHQIIECSF